MITQYGDLLIQAIDSESALTFHECVRKVVTNSRFFKTANATVIRIDDNTLECLVVGICNYLNGSDAIVTFPERARLTNGVITIEEFLFVHHMDFAYESIDLGAVCSKERLGVHAAAVIIHLLVSKNEERCAIASFLADFFRITNSTFPKEHAEKISCLMLRVCLEIDDLGAISIAG